MRKIFDTFKCSEPVASSGPRLCALLFAIILLSPVPALADVTPPAAAPGDVSDITRIVDHLTNTDLLDRLADNPGGISMKMPDSGRVYTLRLQGDTLLIRTDTGQTYDFLLKSVL